MSTIPSACISVCKINAQTDLCEGCWRTIEEITIWATASETLKKEIWEKIQQRAQRYPQQGLSAFNPD